ncbi:MAG: hypothetical protein BM556_02980 [Bacteriovorax sp. MedPE-SWde]|nr:MAG: hypothetical protein BM556_02980 [Bacteriovorax sp. MedPE-SWde]
MLSLVLDFFSTYLIEAMAVMLVCGLIFRWTAYRKSLKEDNYFSTFVSEIEKALSEKEKDSSENVQVYVEDLLMSIKDKLPTRSVRGSKKKPSTSSYNARNVVSLRDFVTGEKGLFHSIIAESGALKSKHPPNYNELTERILEKDENWTKILGFIPIAPVSRLNDTLPGIFVVFGIFGTFIGISMALPEIANIDFNNLEKSGEVLTRFVLSVTFAMKTSIAGILFSLVMTMLNTLAPVRGLRNKTFKKMSNCFENIWISLHGKKKVEEELIESIPLLLEEVRELKEYVKQSKKAS